MSVDSTTLYRHAGYWDLEQIASRGWNTFHNRLDEPILRLYQNEEYANSIALDWHAEDLISDFAGFVLAFEIQTSHLRQYELESWKEPNSWHYCVPPEKIKEFNEQIIGKIRLLRAFYGDEFKGAKWPDT